MGIKLLYKDIKSYINSIDTGNGCLLVTSEEEFENEKHKQNKTNATVNLSIKCKCGNDFNVNYNKFNNQNKKQCNECSAKIRIKNSELSYNDIKTYIEGEHGNQCTLLTTKEEFKKLKVKLNKSSSNIKIKIMCKCGDVFEATYKAFKSQNKKTCNKCTNSKRWSFDELNTFVKNKSNCELLSVNRNKNITLYLKCSCGDDFKVLWNGFKKGKIVCDSCTLRKKYEIGSSHRKKLQESFKEKVYRAVGNEYEVKGKYINSRTHIRMKHNNHSCNYYEWDVMPDNFINTGSRCPKCQHKSYKRTTDEFKQDIFSLTVDEFSLLSDYIGTNENVKMKHNICGNIFYMTPHNFLAGQRCPICKESKGEQKIRKYLIKNNINFISQYEFDDLIGLGGGLLKYDFAVFDNKNNLKLLIEYDGEFHFKKYFEEQNFETQQTHDQMKDEYCKKSNIKLIRIPYWDFDNIEEILNEVINNG